MHKKLTKPEFTKIKNLEDEGIDPLDIFVEMQKESEAVTYALMAHTYEEYERKHEAQAATSSSVAHSQHQLLPEQELVPVKPNNSISLRYQRTPRPQKTYTPPKTKLPVYTGDPTEVFAAIRLAISELAPDPKRDIETLENYVRRVNTFNATKAKIARLIPYK